MHPYGRNKNQHASKYGTTQKGKRIFKAIITAMSIALATACSNAREETPIEYLRIKIVVNQLAANNKLGDNQILFSVVSGKYASYLAKEIGLCKDNEYGCVYFTQLDPFKNYNEQINETLRQAYIFGDINGYAHSNGTIEIPRHVFRIIGDDDTKLACLISHEIAHVIEKHDFTSSRELSERNNQGEGEETEIIEAEISRKHELLADKKSVELTTRAGYPADSCIDFIRFLHESSGDGGLTKEASTHPGVKERINALEQIDTADFLANNQTKEKISEKAWTYSKAGNFLIFDPQENNYAY
jgi:hypothetical protein